LCRQQQSSAIEAVCPDSAEGREKQDGDLACESSEAQKERRTRESVDEPAHRDLLNPDADIRDKLAAEEQAEIAMT
jgi:hypothetical protein